MTLPTRLIALLLMLFVAAPALADAGIRLPEYQTESLDNGATLMLVPKRDIPMVALNIAIRGGSLADPESRHGTSMLLAELLQKGAGQRDAAAFAEAIDAVGGRLDVSAGTEALRIQGEFLAKDAGLMVELLADLLVRPQLSPKEFDKVRERAIQSIQAAKDSGPDGLIGTYADAWLFGPHAYARPTGGDETSLAAITLDDLKAFRRAHLGSDRAIITVVGDFDPAALRRQLNAALKGWPKASGTLPEVTPAPAVRGRRVLLVDKPGATQTYYWMGNVGAAVNDPQRTAQDLVQTVFGGRFTSMLNTALRVESGLTYGARAAIERLATPAAASIRSFTRTDATEQALDLTLDVIDRLHAQPISAELIASGRNYMLGQFPPRLETHAQLAAQLTRLSLAGLGREEVEGLAKRLNALTPESVNAAKSVFPTRDDLAIVLIGDAAKIRETAAKYGEVTEMALSDPRFAP